MMTRFAFYMLLTCCSMIVLSPSSYAEMVPRVAYVVPASDGSINSPSYLGKYWYLGVGFLDTSDGGLIGPSIRYGFGATGKKINLSYLAGGNSLSLEGGISYIKQEPDATLLVDQTYEGFAFEASLRYGITTATFITTGDTSAVEVGLGF